MKLRKKEKANKALSAEAAAKTSTNSDLFSLILLIFSMIGISTVLQLVFLA